MVNEFLGRDIKLVNNDLFFSSGQDFGVVNDTENLAQAVANRLSTLQGEYVSNKTYGSEIHEDLGLPANDFILSAIQGHIVETLSQEPRVQKFKIISLTRADSTITINLEITPIYSQQPFNMVYPLYVEA